MSNLAWCCAIYQLCKVYDCTRAGCISLFYEKPTGDDLDKVRSVSKNATEENPFEASMGIYVFKRDVLVSLHCALLFPAPWQGDMAGCLAH